MKKKNFCLFAGSFDPFTNGHLEILKKSSGLFSKMFLVVSENLRKKPHLPLEFRYKLIKLLVKKHKLSNVEVLLNKDVLTSLLAKKLNCEFLLRGIRNSLEFEQEKIIAKNNSFINESLTTIFVMIPEPHCYISSSVFWEIFFYKNTATKRYVDDDIYLEINKYFQMKG
ncbi:pantetheine-phosphate adenylyltransferase [symbiont of Argiope bruennichi]|uniref:pantetheine-phosphate adenylyltransferase n=1 Tax=symbiont of Argiope bruennichi TaxID=2810479 RepID=UPI003DA3E682